MSKLLGAIIGGTAGALALLLMLIGCLWFYFLNIKASRNKNSDAGSSNQSTFVGSNGDVQLTIAKGARHFTLEELEQATKNFSENSFVGVGSFGLVYKGLLLDGTVVAIKKRQGSPKQEFVEEVMCLSALWHRNIVTLIGYCQENSLQLLVYEYVPNGSVSSHLHDKGQDSSTKLEFKQRLAVAIGAGKGLSYIHSQIPIQVHNGFKTSNVLVDESFIAKVADVGIVKLLQRIEGNISSSEDQIYHDPEVGERNDVYSFGIFLLELITGQEFERNQSLYHWVETNRDSTEFIDQRLATNFTSEGMKEIIDLTIRCLSSNYKERPKLEMVVKELDRILDIEMTLTTVMGDSTAIVTLGNITSFFVVMAPVPTFYRIYKKKSTESFQSIPYAVAVFSATLWLYYGMLTRDVLLLTINAATLLIEATYLAIYLTYAPSKARAFTVKLIFLLDIGLFGAMTLLTLIFLKGKRRINFVGGFCAAFAVSVFVAPLSIIKLVIKTKSVEYMPFGLSFFLTLSALAWFCYGLLLKDFFVALPNVVGFLFGMVQMILYFAYMNARTVETNSNLTEVVSTENHGGTPNIEIEVVEKNGMPEAAKPEA